jgi:hypothetical protein
LITLIGNDFNNKAKKKKIGVFTVTFKKNLGSVGRDHFLKKKLLSSKPEIVVPGSGIRYFIFEISGKMTNYAVFLPSLLLSWQLNK